MTTLRAIENRRKERHGSEDGLHCCVTCGWNWPCPDYSDAVAALAILDAAPIPKHGEWVAHRNYRLVTDPHPNQEGIV